MSGDDTRTRANEVPDDDGDNGEWRFGLDDVGPDGVTEDTSTPASEPIEPGSIDAEQPSRRSRGRDHRRGFVVRILTRSELTPPRGPVVPRFPRTITYPPRSHMRSYGRVLAGGPGRSRHPSPAVVDRRAVVVDGEALAPGANFIVVGIALIGAGLGGLLLTTLGVAGGILTLLLAVFTLVFGGAAFYGYHEFDLYGGKGAATDQRQRQPERKDRDGV
jgi:hypothetical protein